MADHEAVASNAKFLDALDRAWRTMWQGFILDALVAIGMGLLVLLETGDLSSPLFWSAVALLVGKSFAMSFASFLARLKVDPKTPQVKPEVVAIEPAE
jgi:hypothetical protein